MKTRSFGERLGEKSVQALVTDHFRERYHYNLAMAEAILKGAVFVRTRLRSMTREDGHIIRYLPKPTQSTGKPLHPER